MVGIKAGSANKISVFRCELEDRFIFILMKTIHPSHFYLFGYSLTKETLCVHLYSHIVPDSTRRCLSVRRSCFPRLGWWLLENPTTGTRSLYHVTHAAEPGLGCQKTSVTPSLQTSSYLTQQNVIL